MQKKNNQKRKIKIPTLLVMGVLSIFFLNPFKSFADFYEIPAYFENNVLITTNFPVDTGGGTYQTSGGYNAETFSGFYDSGSFLNSGGSSGWSQDYRNSLSALDYTYYGDGNFYKKVTTVRSGITFYYKWSVVNGIVIGAFDDISTHIISLTPEDKAVFPAASSSAMTFSLEYYINPDQFDFWNNYNINVYLHNIDQNVLLASSLSPSDIVLINEDVDVAGYHSFSTTTVVLAEGNYRIVAKLRENIFNITTIDEVSHQFIVGSSTFIGNISQNTYTAINGYYASSSATSTDSLASACGLFSDSSSVKNCLAFLFVPDGALIYNSLSSFKEQASTHFPLGYVTDFITIISSSASTSLPVLDITIPEGIAGTGASITLDVASIGWIFNATSSIGTEAQKGKTIFEIVNPYWEIVCYFAFGFYILRRILGSQIISKFY